MFIIFFFAVDEIVSACSVTCNVYIKTEMNQNKKKITIRGSRHQIWNLTTQQNLSIENVCNVKWAWAYCKTKWSSVNSSKLIRYSWNAIEWFMCLICTVVRNPFRVIFQNLNQNEKETKLIAIQEFQNKEAKIATTKNRKKKKQSTKQMEK